LAFSGIEDKVNMLFCHDMDLDPNMQPWPRCLESPTNTW